jgi:hypothetical protein
MWTIHKFVDSAMKKLNNTKKIREDLITFLAPHMAACSTFCCTRGKTLPAENKHNESLVIVTTEVYQSNAEWLCSHAN